MPKTEALIRTKLHLPFTGKSWFPGCSFRRGSQKD